MAEAAAPLNVEPARVPVAAGETAVSAVATRERALVEARYTMALARPRDFDTFRRKVLEDAARPGFAAGAIYSLPRAGKKIEGPSIRFVESALRAFGNVDVQATALFDDGEKQIVRVTVTDLESNSTYSSDHTVSKRIERRKLRDGQVAIDERVNSSGERVFIVEATDDEIAQKVGVIVSKATRTLGLRLLPGDVVEEGVAAVRKTMTDRDAKDPAAARKGVIDAFASLNVQPIHLRDYLGHDVAQSTPAELATLRELFAALRDGQTTWVDVMQERAKQRAAEGDGDQPLSEGESKKLRELATKRAEELAKKLDDPSITADLILKECVNGDETRAQLAQVTKRIAKWEPGAPSAEDF